MFTPSRTTAALLAALLAATGCGKKEAPKPAETPAAVQPAAPAPAPLAVGTIDLGKSVDATSKVAMAAESFGPRDTIYASVATTGAGTGATLAAKWSFVKASGALIPVNESSQTITTTGPVNTEFHITKATPWPKGKYRVEISLNGAAAGTKDFEVK